MTELRAFQFRLTMRPIHLAGQWYHSRTGLLFCDASTGTHWGEASPLPYFSPESLDDVVSAWRNDEWFSLPSMRFAHDALTSARLHASRMSSEFTCLPINALIAGNVADGARESERIGLQSYPAVKVKVGPQVGTPRECADYVIALRQRLRSTQTLRLDANRGWSLEEAIQFGRHLSCEGIEYCEEPIRSPDDLEAFWEATCIPYALDETLRESHDLKHFPHAAALVVKPMLTGGRSDLQRLYETGVRLVFSGSFETGIGTHHIACLANEFAKDTPAGLNSYSWLTEDVINPRWTIENGCLQIQTRIPTSAIQWQHLEEIQR